MISVWCEQHIAGMGDDSIRTLQSMNEVGSTKHNKMKVGECQSC